ncbi:hypothetical protein ACJX0J_020673, partial [Zea mays]
PPLLFIVIEDPTKYTCEVFFCDIWTTKLDVELENSTSSTMNIWHYGQLTD